MRLFRSFRLDPVNQCLWHGEQRVALTPKAFDVLRYLVEHPGRLVTHDELLEALWPGTYVNPELIKKYILGIRKVLGDQHERPLFIETLPKRGYQFIAPVTDDVAPEGQSSESVPNMVGREGAFRNLQGALSKALRGQRRLVFVAGEPGIGKTTLVDSFHQQASRSANLRTARGQCVEGFGGKEPYYPVLEALGQLTRAADSGSVVQTLARRAPTWLVQFPSLLKPEQKAMLQNEILGATRERMLREICEALESVSSDVPLLLVIEDLHWVDASTLDLLSAIARRREMAKLMVVCTYRPVDVILSNSPLKRLKQDLLVHDLCSEIVLERLSESAIAEYLGPRFSREEVLDSMTKLIYRHSGGSPLFMIAIVQDLVKRGLVAAKDERWTLTSSPETIDLGVPDSLQQMLELQFDALTATQQRVLEAGSVVGEQFSAWVIASALEEKLDQVEDVLDELDARQQVIKPIGSQELPNGLVAAHYEFRHSLYRQATYRRLSSGRKSRLHLAVAKGLQGIWNQERRALASELAFHFENGREYEQAARFLIIAAENAAARFAYRDCISVLEHALELIRRIKGEHAAELEVHILEFIGDAHYALGAMAESANAYESAASRAADNGLKVAQVSALSAMVRPFGFIDPDRGIAAVNRAASVARDIESAALVARTEMLAAGCRLLYEGWNEDDAVQCSRAYEKLCEVRDSETPPFHRMIYAHVQVLKGNYREAFEIFDEGIPTGQQTKSLMEHVFAISGKTVALLRIGRLGDVLRIVQDGKQMAERNGNDPWLFNFREAWLRMLALDFEGSLRVCESILAMNVSYPVGQPQTIARIAKGYAAIARGLTDLNRGEYDLAIEAFNQVRDPHTTPKFFLHWTWRMTAQLGLSDAWLKLRDIDKARNEADGYSHSALRTADPYLRALAWEMQARIAIFEKDWSAAQNCIRTAIETVNRYEVPAAAWRVYDTASQFCRQRRQHDEAEAHRKLAEATILKIANSFAKDEPLRGSFLTSMPIRRILSPKRERMAADI